MILLTTVCRAEGHLIKRATQISGRVTKGIGMENCKLEPFFSLSCLQVHKCPKTLPAKHKILFLGEQFKLGIMCYT